MAERCWLMRPPKAVDHFDGYNTFIHGITPAMVANAPWWNELLPPIVDFIGDDIVVAHNAGFDVGVIRYARAVDNIEGLEMHFLCTMVVARRALFLPSYRLPFVVGGRRQSHVARGWTGAAVAIGAVSSSLEERRCWQVERR
jgi:DNA polymerase-3 subunit epsilon